MEQTSDLLTPMHEQWIEDKVDNIVIESFFELLAEDVVVLVQRRKHLNKTISTICSKIE